MITAQSGLHIVKGSVMKVALSLVAVLSVIPYSGHLPDGQIMLKWFCAGIAFCTTVIIQILFACTCTSKDSDTDVVGIRSFVIPFLIAFLMVGIHSLLQVTGVVPVNSLTDSVSWQDLTTRQVWHRLWRYHYLLFLPLRTG